jgi:hypothetical protein
MCPILGVCPGQGVAVGGYAIVGDGIPADAIIRTVDGPGQVTMTRAATRTATGVALRGGRPNCLTGGAPNGSTGGRGWWEHMSNRYNWDGHAQRWVLVQNSGTWLYDDVGETWQRIVGPIDPNYSYMCGSGDYTSLATGFSSDLDRTIAWCGTQKIFALDYGSGAPDYIGAHWVQLHQMPAALQNPNTDVLSQMTYDTKRKRFYMFRDRTNPYTMMEKDPWLAWFDPFAAPSCETHAPPCGQSGLFDKARPNYPQHSSTPRMQPGNVPDTSVCWTTPCQQMTASIAYNPIRDEVLFVGRRAGDAQILLWVLTDPMGPNEKWTILDSFQYTTYESHGTLKLWTDGQAPAEFDQEQNLASSTMSLLAFDPIRDVLFLITRSGSGPAGASTRGTRTCKLNGVPDDCFRMYGFKFPR